MKKLIPIFVFCSLFSFGQNETMIIPKVKKTFYPMVYRQLDLETNKGLPIYTRDCKVVYETNPKRKTLKYTCYEGNSSKILDQWEMSILKFYEPDRYIVQSLVSANVITLSESFPFVTASNGSMERIVSNSIDDLPITPFGVDKYPFLEHLTAQSINKVLNLEVVRAKFNEVEVPHVEEDDRQFIFYTIPGSNEHFFSNAILANNTQSYGLITSLEYIEKYSAYFFFWEFENTYDDVAGVAKVYICQIDDYVHANIFYREQVLKFILKGDEIDLSVLEQFIEEQ